MCLSPTYELALQTGKVIEQMGKFHPELKLAYAVRGNKCKYKGGGLNRDGICKLGLMPDHHWLNFLQWNVKVNMNKLDLA